MSVSKDLPVNSVEYLSKNKFRLFPLELKKQIKILGRPTPNLPNLIQSIRTGHRTYTRVFKNEFYKKWSWLCGCNIRNALFCFPCILFNAGDILWSNTGLKDLNHLNDRTKKHELSSKHVSSCLELALVGTENNAEQLDSTYRKNLSEFNKQVKHNRYILNMIINAIKFCGIFKVALRGHDEIDIPSNSDIFKGLINYTTEIDSELKKHLEKATVFKSTVQTIQDELLQIMYSVCQLKIKEEVKKSNYVSIIVDDISDVSNSCQMAFVLRYIVHGKPVERFWTYLNVPLQNDTSLASCILKEMEILNLNKTPEKVIGQSYDGAAVISGSSNGVQTAIKTHYPLAEFVHCNAHQLNLVLMKACSINPSVKVFFANVQGICAFFSTSSQITAFLDDIVTVQLLRFVPTRWNFQSRSINVLFDYKADIIKCMETIVNSSDIKSNVTINRASGFMHILNSPEFSFWLDCFDKIMPLIEHLVNQLEQMVLTPETDVSFVNASISHFEENILKIRDSINTLVEENNEPSVKRRKEDLVDLKRQAQEVCDVMICQVKERFTFTGHLKATSLFGGEQFIPFEVKFPNKLVKEVCEMYKFLNLEKLKSELIAIYSTKELIDTSGPFSLYEFLMSNNLQQTCSNTLKLLEVLITLPMASSEVERCLSTLKRIKSYIRNSTTEKRLCSLTMLSIERDLISNIPDFNEKVIEMFVQQKHRRKDFSFK